MPNTDSVPTRHHVPKMFAFLAGLACVGCCLLPVLIAAGVAGVGTSAVVGWLPATVGALAVLAVGTWWIGHRRSAGRCGCAGEGVEQGECVCRVAAPTSITVGERQ